MVDVPVPEEDLQAWFDLIDAIELDPSAPQDLQDKLANAIQARNNYGAGQQASGTDTGVAAPA